MKKFILILGLILGLIVLVACEKENKYLEVQILNICQDSIESTVIYQVVNNSDMDIYSKIYFSIDGTKQIGWESDCTLFPAHCNMTLDFTSIGFVNSVDYKLKSCEI